MNISRTLRGIVAFAAITISCYAVHPEKVFSHEQTFSSVEQGFLLDPQSNNRIEFFTMKPKGEGPFPVVFLLHGHQIEPTTGGKQLVDLHWVDVFTREGILAVSISIPGFGNSEGIRDFSGPNSQKAVAAVIQHFSHLPFVDPKRMGIYGCSKGATLASMVHAYYPDLLVQILEAGWYDLNNCIGLMPNYLERIKENIVAETGASEEALKERSAVHSTQIINSKTLILVGEFDDRRTLPSAVALHDKLTREGKDCQLKVFPRELHCLSADKWEAIIPFVRKHFFDLYGIGIKPVLIMPAIHIAKIFPSSPADLSEKLKIGDVILRISPNNDEEEIDVLRMAIPQFISLTLGKKGTTIRLHVQHFDQTYEDIVIERG